MTEEELTLHQLAELFLQEEKAFEQECCHAFTPEHIGVAMAVRDAIRDLRRRVIHMAGSVSLDPSLEFPPNGLRPKVAGLLQDLREMRASWAICLRALRPDDTLIDRSKEIARDKHDH